MLLWTTRRARWIEMSELIQLQSSLAQIFREALSAPTSWENPKAVKKLQSINQALDGVSPKPSTDSIAIILAEYRRTQSVTSYRDQKYVCYGTALQMPDGWCVLGNEKLRDKLLADVEQLDETRRRFKCFQALLSSYFAFALYDEQTPEAAKTGWQTLRDWLARQRAQFQRESFKNKFRLPGWFAVLIEHENLLTATPCDRYGRELLRGDGNSIEDARKGLGIPRNSWVMQEVILSQMKAAVELRDNPFKDHLDRLLEFVQGKSSLAVSELLKRRAIAMLVSRYARCASKPEHPVLRDAAVAIIGNPWLKRSAWDAVKNYSEQPDVEAREMVNGWLKQRLITDFFAVLSEDGQADQRRLNYWLRFEPAIEDLWLVLGPDAMKNKGKPYRDLRERANGRLLSLENGGSSSNNAFIMRMGDWLIVEFGLINNACFIYSREPAPFSLEIGDITESKLKILNKHNWNGVGKKYSHNGNWEDKFDAEICPKIAHWPSKIPITLNHNIVPEDNNNSSASTFSRTVASNIGFDETEFWNRIKRYSVPTEDSRRKGGALWVNIEQSRYPMIDQWLESLDFKYKLGRGWWRE